MSRLPMRVAVARPQDAETWLRLHYLSRGQRLPGDIAREVERFRSAPAGLAENRFIAWLGDEPTGVFELCLLDNVVEIRNLFVADDYLDNYGAKVLERVV